MDDSFIKKLQKEKDRIISQIRELKDEYRTITKILARHQTSEFGSPTGETVNKKNMNRIMNEHIILDAVKKHSGQLRTKDLAEYVDINPNTLRSYVMRLRDKGFIQKNHNHKWCIKKTE